jgi:hypothetical protein
MNALGNGKTLGERGDADQTNSGPLFPMGLAMTTSSPAEADGTADGTVSEDTEGGSIFPTSSSLTRRAHNSHITSNKYFFSSFNNAGLLHSMSADCCMPQRQKLGPLVAVGGRWPPWLACVYFA